MAAPVPRYQVFGQAVHIVDDEKMGQIAQLPARAFGAFCDRYEDRRSEVTRLKNQVLSLQASNTATSSRLNTVTAERDVLQLQVTSLTQQLADERGVTQQGATQQATQQAALSDQVTQLTAANAQLRAENMSLASSVRGITILFFGALIGLFADCARKHQCRND